MQELFKVSTSCTTAILGGDRGFVGKRGVVGIRCPVCGQIEVYSEYFAPYVR